MLSKEQQSRSSQGKLWTSSSFLCKSYNPKEISYKPRTLDSRLFCYFLIHPISGNFLPLAIRTHICSDLTFTPLDDENDWLIAKMALEMKDLFNGQLYHLSNTHDVAEPVHQAALRTSSKRHPVRGYLDRCTLGNCAWSPKIASY